MHLEMMSLEPETLGNLKIVLRPLYPLTNSEQPFWVPGVFPLLFFKHFKVVKSGCCMFLLYQIKGLQVQFLSFLFIYQPYHALLAVQILC